MAPEALKRYGAVCEMYSFGLVLLELVTGRLISGGTLDKLMGDTDDGTNPQGLEGQLLLLLSILLLPPPSPPPFCCQRSAALDAHAVFACQQADWTLRLAPGP